MIERRADAHQIARPVVRQKLRGEFAHVLALALALADREPADGEPIERHFAQDRRAFAPQLREERALHDAEQRLRRISARREASRRPAMRDLERRSRRRFIRRRGDALVEHHHDVAADRLLRLDAQLRAEQDRVSVDIALERRALLAHRPRVRQREDLKPARVREHRVFPAHEPVNAAGAAETLPGPAAAAGDTYSRAGSATPRLRASA